MSLPPVECKYVTEECIREWKSGNQDYKLPEPVPVLRFLYELCWTLVRGELPFQKYKAAMDSVEFSDKVPDEDLSSILADVVTQMAQDLTMPGEYRARLIKLAKWLVESSIVPLKFFQERCEEEFLWDSEMIKIKAADLKSKEVRVNTRLLYQQTKFNLLREESEGYAKLVTLLCRGSEISTPDESGAIVGIIKSLIGHFDLDPNRVFDIVLECFELQPHIPVFLGLIPIFPKSHASQILGFKFQYYQRMEVNTPVPFGLYQLTALLVKQDFIDLDSIYAHLLPQDDEAFEHYSAFSSKRLDEANRIGKINLAATGKDLMVEDDKQGDVTADLFAALDMENKAVNERASELDKNQILGLLTGFLSVNDWYHAHILFARLSPLNPVEHIQICEELFRFIERSISSTYELVRQKHLQTLALPSAAGGDSMDVDSPISKSFIDVPKELFEMLSCAGPYLYRDTLLLQKVCRVLRSYYLSALELFNTGGASAPNTGVGANRTPRLHFKDARLRIEEALGSCLLPSLQLIPANPAVGQELWEVMSLLPYEVRYRLYGEWEKDDEQIPMILAARQTAKLDTRRILKRLAKENLKQLGRMVAKLAHACPMTVLRTIVHQIEAYRDMIAPVVDAFKYLTQLEYDVLEYVVIERLAQGGRDKLKDDGLNLSDWLLSLASFWGHLCKKYPSMELRGLFQYLVNQLKKGNGIELVLLQELIQQMANVQYTENMTEDQLDAMAGSDTLRYQATSFGISKNNKALIKSTNRLRDSLLPKEDQKIAVPLLLLIAQHRSLVVINANAPHIKMVSEQFDRCHGTLLQFVDFLYGTVTPATAYAHLIPSLEELVHKYHLEPEAAFLIYRPVMRLFKCQNGSDVCWPLDDSEAQKSLITEESGGPTDCAEKLVLDVGPPREPLTWSGLLDTVRKMLPSKAWNSLSPDLYATFWGLTLYDLYVPKNRYESEIAKQHAALKALEELSDNSSSAITKRKKEKERIQESMDRLTSELQKHEENVASVRRRLSREKDQWLSSCPDTLKINMEFLQRCIFPRCTFSMPDAVYCAMFVHTLHSLGTPFFNTVNHIDVLICKTLHPMICCCTENEAGRLGRFLYETLKIAYHWKSDESIYERECGNMPGFAVYYRYPNSQRVAYSQFIRVHWKWSQRITRLLIQCLESAEHMEIRNALIMLTKISGVFPVTRKSGINLEKRVAKIKSDEREDLKVLATGVAAAMAARKSSWVTEEEFGMGYLEHLKAPPASKASTSNSVPLQNGSRVSASQGEPSVGRVTAGIQHPDSGVTVKDQVVKTKSTDAKLERAENSSSKPDLGQIKQKNVLASDAQTSITSPAVQGGNSKPENQKHSDDSAHQVNETVPKSGLKTSTESEVRGPVKRPSPAGSLLKQPRQDLGKEDGKPGKSAGRTSSLSTVDRDVMHPLESRGVANPSSASSANGNTLPASTKGSTPSTKFTNANEPKAESSVVKSYDSKAKEDSSEVSNIQRPTSLRPAHSPRHETASRSSDKPQKRASPAEDLDRLNKRRKGEIDSRDIDGERSSDPRLSDRHFPADFDKSGSDEPTVSKTTEKIIERSKDKGSERHDRDYRERLERPDKSRADEIALEKSRDSRSMERYGRERSVDRGSERASDRLPEKTKDDRNRDDRGKLRHSEKSMEKSHLDDRFHGQSLPPPPPLPPHVVPQSVNANAGRRDDDADRRFATSRHSSQRLSPRHDDRERRRSEENAFIPQDDNKRRREEDFRDRKRDERDGVSLKVDERDRDRERDKTVVIKEDTDTTAAASKRRKLKREHLPEAGEYSPAATSPPPPPPPLTISLSQPYDGRDRGDRKGGLLPRPGYVEEPSLRNHGKEPSNKITRHETEQLYDREWEEEKRQRAAEPKRRHRK